MIKYAKSDIIDGINSLKIGIGNIISSVARQETPEYILDIPIEYSVIVSSLRKLFPEKDIQYADKVIKVTFDSSVVDIIFGDNEIIFNLNK